MHIIQSTAALHVRALASHRHVGLIPAAAGLLIHGITRRLLRLVEPWRGSKILFLHLLTRAVLEHAQLFAETATVKLIGVQVKLRLF